MAVSLGHRVGPNSEKLAANKIAVQAPDAQSTSVVNVLPSDVTYNADRTRAYIARDDGNISVYDTFTGTVIATWDVGTKLGGMDISADGSFLLVVEKEPVSSSPGDNSFVFAVHKVDTTTGAVTDFTRTFFSIEGPFYDVALFADGTAVVTTTLRGSGATTTYRLDTATGVFSQLVSSSAQAPIVTASADRLSILLTNGFNVSGPTQTYSLTAEGVVTLVGSRGSAGSGNSVHAFSADGTLAALLDQGGIDIFDFQLNKLTTIPGTPGGSISGVAFDDQGDFLYVLDGAAHQIVKYSTADWSVAGTIPFTENLPGYNGNYNAGGTLVVGPDAQYFLFRGDDAELRLENPLAIAPVQGSDGVDAMIGTNGADVLYALGGNDTMIGGGGDDTLRGGSGNDVIDGGTGHDAMYGGDGDDTYVVDDVRDLALEASAAGGNDQVISSVSYELAGNIEQLVLTGTAANGTGNAIANTIYGNGADNVLSGMGGNDLLIGGGGNDTLKGGTGADSLYGGTGNDTYEVDRADDLVFENSNEGTDTVLAAASYYLYANIENLTLTGTAGNFGVGNGLDNVITGNNGANLLIGGGGNDTLVGGGGADQLYGEDGNDTLNGGALSDILVGGEGDDVLDGGTGNDRLYGGNGNETYYVDSSQDLIFEDANGGTDTVMTGVSAYLYANVENLVQAGSGNITAQGNELDNTITGNSGNNLLMGGAGNDSIDGGVGNDSIYGEAGNDTLFGGKGDDLIVGGDGNDTIDGGQGADSIYGEDGNDIIHGGISDGANFVSDLLVGGAGNDTIYSNENSFNDNVYGGAGDDTFYVETYVYYNGPGFATRNELVDLVFEDADGGNDTVYFSTNDSGTVYYMTANVENLFLVGSAKDAVGNATANVMTGNTAGNLLLGGGGNDTINGKSGNDVLFGEAGADTFVFERGTGGDVIGDFAVGTDKIDLRDFGFASYQDVVNSMHQNGGTTAIDLGNGDFIVLNGVAANTLSQGDFILNSGSSAKTVSWDHFADSAPAIEPVAWTDFVHTQIWHGAAISDALFL